MEKVKCIIPKAIGYILISPAIAGVIIFFMQLLADTGNHDLYKKFQFTIWQGDLIPVLPLYFGIMAIVGAYLIKDTTNKKEI